MMDTIMFVIWVMTMMGWITLEILHHRERTDLYNRLMAANYTDYIQQQTSPPKAKGNPLRKSIKDAYQNLKNLDDE